MVDLPLAMLPGGTDTAADGKLAAMNRYLALLIALALPLSAVTRLRHVGTLAGRLAVKLQDRYGLPTMRAERDPVLARLATTVRGWLLGSTVGALAGGGIALLLPGDALGGVVAVIGGWLAGGLCGQAVAATASAAGAGARGATDRASTWHLALRGDARRQAATAAVGLAAVAMLVGGLAWWETTTFARVATPPAAFALMLAGVVAVAGAVVVGRLVAARIRRDLAPAGPQPGSSTQA